MKKTGEPSAAEYGPPALATGGWFTGAPTPGPNAMLLHLPTAEVSQTNFLDTRGADAILRDKNVG